jgi:hypothetical protein
MRAVAMRAGDSTRISPYSIHHSPQPTPVPTMRALLRLAACVAILAAFSTRASSQGILDRIAKKASDAVTQKAQDKVDSKIDEMSQKLVDNSFSAMFGDSAGTANKTGAGASGSAAGGPPFSIGGNATTESSYSFNVVTTMEIESSKSSKSDGKAVLKMHFNTAQPYTGTLIVNADPKQQQQGSAFVVLDAKNQAMVMLMASDKSKFSMAYGWNDAQKYAPVSTTAAAAPKTPPVNWDTVKVWNSYSKIGTKTIAGYSADGYRMETPDATVETWVSRDERLSVGNMFAANSGLKQMKGRLPADYPQGMLLQMTSANNKTGEKVTMTVTSIDTDAHVTYNMSDYPKISAAKK